MRVGRYYVVACRNWRERECLLKAVKDGWKFKKGKVSRYYCVFAIYLIQIR